MCLRAFLRRPSREPEARYAELAPGARRLGAAFQKVNFLRDLGDDRDDLGRSYLPGLDPEHFDVRDARRACSTTSTPTSLPPPT